VFVRICVYSFHTCFIRFGACQNHIHIQLIVKKTCCEKKERKTQQHRVGTNVRVRGLNAGLLARSQFAFGRSCDRPTRSRFSVVFLGPRANAELVPKVHVALHASHAALPMVALGISHCTKVTSKYGDVVLQVGRVSDETVK
jgi:hypothetical protein